MRSSTVLPFILASLALPAIAQEAFTPETLTTESRIAEGPNVLVMDQSWNGPSKIDVLSADGELKMKGNIGPGTTAQMVLSRDGKTLYTASVYMERFVYGPLKAIVHEWDVASLSRKREFEIPVKLAHVESQPGLFALTEDETYLLAQNATPATSVSVIDLGAGKAIAEIPTPGCWTAIPAGPMSFTTICGDGTLARHDWAADGSFTAPKKSEKIFDADADALFANPVRAEGRLVYLSFKGNLYIVDDSGEAPVLTETLNLTDGVLGKWGPGGSEALAYNPATGKLFILMHAGAKEGSHKDPAREIWTYDLAAKKLVGRSEAHHENTLAVSKGEKPVLFAASEEGNLTRYDYAEEAGEVFLTKAGEFEGLSSFPALITTDF
ncbi:amine dehydrogenase large subunit [Paracoccus ravus]|uniref:amine dehydrogenase large subunit n=1 Tax=Paracoccus ravus TaxID=2447760 RepID=UPI00106E6F8C|nr:amine dehydrogenase large subunit [Paracoccus ravus]